jgi:hypothetical protein
MERRIKGTRESPSTPCFVKKLYEVEFKFQIMNLTPPITELTLTVSVDDDI